MNNLWPLSQTSFLLITLAMAPTQLSLKVYAEVQDYLKYKANKKTKEFTNLLELCLPVHHSDC